jgi:hypothetical protein
LKIRPNREQGSVKEEYWFAWGQIQGFPYWGLRAIGIFWEGNIAFGAKHKRRHRIHEHEQDKFRTLLQNKRNRPLEERSEWGEAWPDTPQEREPQPEKLGVF